MSTMTQIEIAPGLDIFTANLDVLADVAPSLATRLADAPQLDSLGRWNFGDGRLRAVHSRRRAVEDAAQALNGVIASGYPSHLVIIGLGAGYALDVIEQWPVATRLLAIEPEPRLLGAMLRRRDWRGWLQTDRLQLVTAPDYTGAFQAWAAFGASELPPVAVHPVIAREMSADVLAARMVFEQMRFGTPLDPRQPVNSQSMLHHTVLALYEHVAATTQAAILEIGAYVGGGTMAICRGIRQSGHPVPFWSLEMGGDYSTHPHLPSSDIFGDLQHNLRTRNLDRFVTLIQAPAEDREVATRLQKEIAPIGLSLFSIDADGDVQRDFDNYLHLCRPGCIVFVDDYSSPHALEKVAPTREAVDRMVAAGVLRPDGVHGWGTWVGRVIHPPRT